MKNDTIRFSSDFRQECRAAIVWFSRDSEQSLNRHINVILIDFTFPAETFNHWFVIVMVIVVLVMYVCVDARSNKLFDVMWCAIHCDTLWCVFGEVWCSVVVTLWCVFGEVWCSVLVTLWCDVLCWVKVWLSEMWWTWYYSFDASFFVYTFTSSLFACSSIVDPCPYVTVEVEVHDGE